MTYDILGCYENYSVIYDDYITLNGDKIPFDMMKIRERYYSSNTPHKAPDSQIVCLELNGVHMGDSHMALRRIKKYENIRCDVGFTLNGSFFELFGVLTCYEYRPYDDGGNVHSMVVEVYPSRFDGELHGAIMALQDF